MRLASAIHEKDLCKEIANCYVGWCKFFIYLTVRSIEINCEQTMNTKEVRKNSEKTG